LRLLLVIGLIVILAGFALILIASPGQSSVSSGGAIFIGPFPIVFGSGPGGGLLALLSVVIGGVIIALVLIWGWRLFISRNGEKSEDSIDE